MKSRDGKSQREEKTREKIREEEESKKEDADARKGRKVAKHCVFPMICGSGLKSRLATAAGAEPSGQMRDEKLHVAVARSTFGCESKLCMERSAVFRTYGTKGLRNCSCSGPLECDEIKAIHKYMYIYIYIL